VAAAGNAGKPVALEQIHHREVGGASERPRSLMAVQTFPIVVWRVEMDGLHRLAKILDVHVMQAIQFGGKTAVHSIVGVACVASLIRGNTMILKMCSRHMGRVIHIQASSPGFHHMARKAETCLLGPLQVVGAAPRAAKNRQDAKRKKRQNLSASSVRN